MKRSEQKKILRKYTAVLLAVLMLFLCFCGATAEAAVSGPAPTPGTTPFAAGGTGSSGSNSTNSSGTPAAKTTGSTSKKKTGGGFPEFREASFHKDKAEGNEEVQVDLSACSDGYVALRCEPTSTKIKFQVIKEDLTNTYSVVPGEDQIFPLQSGNGKYLFKVMKNISGKKYAELYSCEADVKIDDPFDPFLRPNQYANYEKDSDCVKLAGTFVGTKGDVEGFITTVYEYICSHVTYDTEKAKTVQSGYLPDPDATLKDGKGICFDYACLTASMLRSQGVPCQIIFGYVAPDDIYHAWNKFYTEKGGWTLVEFKVNAKEWNRVDLTFHANSASNEFIGDGSNYLEAYIY